MRLKQIRKWLEEGGDLPQDLTPKEKEHLEGLGWKARRQWHRSGQLEQEYSFLHGKEHGKWRRWYDNGQLWLERNYIHGMPHGVKRGWHDDGQLWQDEEWFYGNKIK
jgi:antitoxin component YwqK of YwqJK toxin-antitoxin module